MLCRLFFFSSRRRHTRLQGDWSSDVCSSDLVDAALEVGVVGRHVVCADLVVETQTGAAHRERDVIAGLEFRNAWANLFHATKAFVPKYQIVAAVGGGSIFGRIDFLVRAVHTDSKDLHQHAATIRNVGDAWLWDLRQMHAPCFAR